MADQEDAPYVIAGSFKSNDGKTTTYGGHCRSSTWHPLKFGHVVEPNGAIQKSDTLNMNGALIPSATLQQIGFLSKYFVHSGADFEYGLKLAKAGGTVYLAEKHIGTCDLNTAMLMPDGLSLTLKERLKLLTDIKREPFRQRLEYYRRYGGLFWPVFWVSPYLTVWFRYVWFSIVRIKHSYHGQAV